MFTSPLLLLLIILIHSSTSTPHPPHEHYVEHLHIQPAGQHATLFTISFQFRRVVKNNNNNHPSYHVFPRAIDGIIRGGVIAFNFTSTRGMWESSWGLPPRGTSGARGVEISGLVNNNATIWTRLIRALSGLTCSSLSQIQFAHVLPNIPSTNTMIAMAHATTTTTRPPRTRTFAQLPSETTCTENLSSLSKLLPCRTKAGLAQVITPSLMVSSQFYSLSMSAHRVCLDGGGGGTSTSDPWTNCHLQGLEFTESLHFVRPQSPLQPHPPSITNLLGGTITEVSSCPAAIETTLHVYPSMTWHQFPNSSKMLFALTNLTTPSTHHPPSSPLHTTRWLSSPSGIDSASGTITTALTLQQQPPSHNHDPLTITHLEIIPSFLHPRLPSIRVIIGNHTLSRAELISILHVSTTRVRGPPTTLYFRLSLPYNKTVLVTYEFDKEFLNFEEFPANPNRGFDIPSAIATLEWHGQIVNVATEALLVALPMPDFSMPYNVITLSCTAFSFFLGSFINATSRVRDDNFAVSSGNSPITRFRALIKAAISRVRG